MKQITDKDRSEICRLYKDNSIAELSKMFSIGDRRVRSILIENGIEIRDTHVKTVSTDDYIEKNRERFPFVEGKHYVAVSKLNGDTFDDYLNKSGCLTNHIKKNIGIEIPSLFKRKKYFHDNGMQWYEQWFDIKSVDNVSVNTKKCPYCGWETVDVENKSGMYLTHIIKEHSITVEEHLEKHPEDIEYLSKQYKKLKKKEKTEIKQKSKNGYVAYFKKDIKDFLSKRKIPFSCNTNSQIDLLVEDKKIGIEFDGLKWHTEWFGKKSHSYHLDKTLRCNEKGYGLIHIFEDEYVNSKDIVLNKISHILGIDDDKPKIYGRKCEVREIYKCDAEDFLGKYHIQGFSSSTVYLGAFADNGLVAVMTFKNGSVKNKGWELSRFATNYNYNCIGLGGKMFKHFVRNYNPSKVFSFADRRWTVDINNNLYTKLGFDISSIGSPDYRYYNDKVDKYKRIHKMTFSKKQLSRKYGFDMKMTETEMAKELGYDRIWDCGLVKYEWKPNE